MDVYSPFQDYTSTPELTAPVLKANAEVVEIDGESLTPELLRKCADPKVKLKLTDDAKSRITASRNVIESIVKSGKVVYGVTTGFGNFANVVIPQERTSELQENLIRSHAVGVGPPLKPYQTRMLLALRINVLAKGYSGMSLGIVEQLVAAFNAYCVSYVPEQGTVGCCGDLCPLAHLALGLMGEGKMWSPVTGWAPANEVLQRHKLKPLSLGSKEGLSFINGTQMIASIGVDAVLRARSIALQADIVAAFTLEMAKGNRRPFKKEIHDLRPHPGQIAVAKRLRAVLPSMHNASNLAAHNKASRGVQDPYVLRCIPQVHGIVHDTIDFAYNVLTTELNSATDNPVIFAETGDVYSCGNFHGEYPSKVLDYLAIAVHELSQMSERRLERLINPSLNNGLPAFLVKEGGINSGFMMVQVTAAALVSENKVLCHPSSADSITTSASQEDHVSMGGFAARKALTIINNVENVIAAELLAACQAYDFVKPLTTTRPLDAVHELVRTVSPHLERDRSMATDIEAVAKLLREEKILDIVRPFLDIDDESAKSIDDLDL